jgi:hypothetical protein
LKLQLNSPQKVGIEHAEAELIKPFQDTCSHAPPITPPLPKTSARSMVRPTLALEQQEESVKATIRQCHVTPERP